MLKAGAAGAEQPSSKGCTMIVLKRVVLISAAVGPLVTAAPAFSQAAGAAQAPASESAQGSQGTNTATVDEVIVTGTRESRVQARESMSPIETLSSAEMEQTGAANLQDALERTLPSINQPGFGGSHSILIKSIKLRGLNPDQVLILVNGKRRHNSALLNLNPGPVAGSDPVDLNLIPDSAIDHIEVLEDGAAAQYGSDAIGGVINVILKSSAHGGSASITSGAYYKGDGVQVGGSVDDGLTLGSDGFLHLSVTAVNNTRTNRSGPALQQTSPGAPYTLTADPYVNKVLGSPANSTENLALNAGKPLDGGAELYGFSTVSHRSASSYERYQGTDGSAVNNNGLANDPPFYPNGYSPLQTLDEYDFSVTGGIKTQDLAGWASDLSSTYGRDFMRFGLEDSLNQSLGTTSPTSFHTSNAIASQWTNNLDLTRPVAVGLPAPLTVSVGAEQRYEDFQIQPGEPASYIQGTVNPTGTPGSVGDFGVTPDVAKSGHRTSESLYADLSTALIPAWRVDLAGRYEHYSDFGNAVTGKFSTRYDVSDGFGVRGTVQTGFRAPSLVQEDYALTASGPLLFPGGPRLYQIQLPVSSPQAVALGSKPLKPEKSVSYSVGLVTEPLAGLDITLDAYQTDIRDRITNSGLLFLGLNPNATQYQVASYFTNGLSTRSQGVESTLNYKSDFGNLGRLRWSLNASYNKIDVTKIAPTPAALAAKGLSLFSPQVLAGITNSAPDTKVVLGEEYSVGRWRAAVHETVLGSAFDYWTPNGATYYKETFTTHVLTDLEIGYQMTDLVTVSVGANNLFNVYPNKVNPIDSGISAGIIYPVWTPISFNGGFYYARLALNF
jgi:iron complex outermembrane receptor protein